MLSPQSPPEYEHVLDFQTPTSQELFLVENDDMVQVSVMEHDIHVFRACKEGYEAAGEPGSKSAQQGDDAEHISQLIVLSNNQYALDGIEIRRGLEA